MGVEIYYTNSLRPHNAGFLMAGDPLVQLNSQPSTAITGFETGQLPAGVASIHRQGTCPSACTASLDGDAAMTVFATFHHMHYTGQRSYIEHYNSAGALQTQRWQEKVGLRSSSHSARPHSPSQLRTLLTLWRVPHCVWCRSTFGTMASK